MEDKLLEVLEHYDFKTNAVIRARGAAILDTRDGLKLLCSCKYKQSKAEFEDFVKNTAKNNGFKNVDCFVRNKSGEIITKGSMQETYVVKEWFDAEESSIKSEQPILNGVKILAKLHNALTAGEIKKNEQLMLIRFQPELDRLFEKRLRELKRVRMYVKDKKTKNEFETEYINMCSGFVDEAVSAIDSLKNMDYKNIYDKALNKGKICHGDYNYHNILEIKYKGEQAVVNFDKAAVGIQCLDFYQYLRKTMEKNDWQLRLGSDMINTYTKYSDFGEEELKLLKILLIFPEKFWKLTNFYYNGKKVWVPQKNLKKLIALKEQQEKKILFIEKILGR